MKICFATESCDRLEFRFLGLAALLDLRADLVQEVFAGLQVSLGGAAQRCGLKSAETARYGIGPEDLDCGGDRPLGADRH